MSEVKPFNPAKAIELAKLCEATTFGGLRRTPWTWWALTRDQALILAELVDDWVRFYNVVHAVKRKELIPPCWAHHPGLAHELAVLTWTCFHAHHDSRTTAVTAAEYYGRYLTTFRTRLDHLLGRDPHECRDGRHPESWRAEADEDVARYSPVAPAEAVDALAEHIIFP